jgi:hypothetical protein
VADSGERDFFISYTGVNRPWAEWIAIQLEQAGYSTVLQAWDFRPGSDFLHQMQQATTTAGRTIAVLSPAYFPESVGSRITPRPGSPTAITWPGTRRGSPTYG